MGSTRYLTLLGFGAALFMGMATCTVSDAQEPASPAGPEITQWMPQPAILVFSRTEGWRHNEGIAGADRFFADLISRNGWGLFTTVDPGVFNPDSLARFELVVFNNATGDILSPAQQSDFETWLRDGGAWIGLHGSGDASQRAAWEWYQDVLIGPQFIGHIMGPQFQMADVVAIEGAHPVLEGVASTWSVEDEWYSFEDVPQSFGMTPIAGLDEGTYAPVNTVVEDWPRDLSMGDRPADHPVIWSRCWENARLFYSALGHTQYVYDNPEYARLLENAVAWTMRQSDPDGSGCQRSD